MLHTPTSPAAPDPGQLLSVTAVPGTRPGRVVVEVIGEVDAYTAPALDVCLHSQARQRGVRELVVDLSRVTFLGAAGVTVLAQAHRRCAVASTVPPAAPRKVTPLRSTTSRRRPRCLAWDCRQTSSTGAV